MTVPSFRNINLQAYKPGKSIIKKKERVIKLSANESALGISNRAKRALKRFNSNIVSNVIKKEKKYLLVRNCTEWLINSF